MMSPASVSLHLLAQLSSGLALLSGSLSLCSGPWQLHAHIIVTNSILEKSPSEQNLF